MFSLEFMSRKSLAPRPFGTVCTICPNRPAHTYYCFRKHAKFEFGLCVIQLICVICAFEAFDASDLMFVVCALDPVETFQLIQRLLG